MNQTSQYLSKKGCHHSGRLARLAFLLFPSGIFRIFPRFATRKESPGQARDYCMKDTRIDGPLQIGRYEKHQGIPTAVHEVDYIKSFKTPEEAMQAARRDHSYLCTYYGRNLDAIADSIARRVDVKIQDVEIIEGKSMKDVIKKEGANPITIDGGRYFLGYSGQE